MKFHVSSWSMANFLRKYIPAGIELLCKWKLVLTVDALVESVTFKCLYLYILCMYLCMFWCLGFCIFPTSAFVSFGRRY